MKMINDNSFGRACSLRLLWTVLSFIIFHLSFSPVAAQQQKFPKEIPAGNYSGITHIGDNRYAVVCDKSPDGFFLFHIDIDTVSGRITSVKDEGFHASGKSNRDQEGIAYQPFTKTLFISGETDNRIVEYRLDGQQTGYELTMPEYVNKLDRNHGLEALCYDWQAERFYTMPERPVRGDSLLWLMTFSNDGKLLGQFYYQLDAVKPKRKGIFLNGVSGLCALSDGRLLVLERTVRVPKLKIGSYVECRLYEVQPSEAPKLQKHLIYKFRTKINLTRRNFANYEGICVAKTLADGKHILLLIADSQQQQGGILRDWLKTIIVEH